MDWIKRHWFLLFVLGIFCWAVYTASSGLAKMAAAVLAAFFLLESFTLWAGLLALWAVGFAFGLPFPNALYDWLPRSRDVTGLNGTITQPQNVPGS